MIHDEDDDKKKKMKTEYTLRSYMHMLILETSNKTVVGLYFCEDAFLEDYAKLPESPEH